jgi:non-homologous end joining protein Ku
MNRPLSVFYYALSALIVCSVGFLATAQNAAQTNQDRIRELQKKHIEVLTVLCESLKERFHSGLESIDSYAEALDELLEAKLALASDKATRIQCLEDRLDNAKKLANFIEASHRAGVRNIDELLRSQAAAVSAEIALLQEQDRE